MTTSHWNTHGSSRGKTYTKSSTQLDRTGQQAVKSQCMSAPSWPWPSTFWPHYAQIAEPSVTHLIQSKLSPFNVLWWQNGTKSRFLSIFGLIVTIFDIKILLVHVCSKCTNLVNLVKLTQYIKFTNSGDAVVDGWTHGCMDSLKTRAGNNRFESSW